MARKKVIAPKCTSCGEPETIFDIDEAGRIHSQCRRCATTRRKSMMSPKKRRDIIKRLQRKLVILKRIRNRNHLYDLRQKSGRGVSGKTY